MTEARPAPAGIALVITLLALSAFSAMGLGLVLTTLPDRMAAANFDEALDLLNATDAAVELAARELGRLDDFDLVLAATQTSVLVDGSPGPRTVAPHVAIDLIELTSLLTCGRTSACSAGQIRASSAERPWGDNNPRWRLFLHLTLTPPRPMPRDGAAVYTVVWIGDDARETDGDPTADGAGPGQEGRYMVRARAESFGPRGARHAVEAELARVCWPDAGGEQCLPGIRVQSWRVVTALVP